jgi:hypothetical protein
MSRDDCRLTGGTKSVIIVSAKAVPVLTVWTDFLFEASYYIITKRPSVVTVGSAFASDLSYDTGGRTILNPWQTRGPTEVSNKKARLQTAALF